jgi:hypothetical protein
LLTPKEPQNLLEIKHFISLKIFFPLRFDQVNVDAICEKSSSSPSPLPTAIGATAAPPGSRIPIQKGEFPPSTAPGKQDNLIVCMRHGLTDLLGDCGQSLADTGAGLVGRRAGHLAMKAIFEKCKAILFIASRGLNSYLVIQKTLKSGLP